MSLDELSSMSLCRNFEDKELEILQQFVHIREYKSAEVLFQQFTPANAFYLLIHGTIELFKILSNGQEDRLRIVRKGDSCGMAALWPDLRHPYSARPLEPCRVYVLTSLQFQEIQGHRMPVAQKMLFNFLRELWQAYDTLHCDYTKLTQKLTQSNIIL